MKKVLVFVLALFLCFNVVGYKNVSALDANQTLTAAEFEARIAEAAKNRPRITGSKDSKLEGYLSKDEFVNSLPKDQKVRIVIELLDDPVLVVATKKGVSVDEMSKSEVASIQNKLTTKQNAVKKEIANKNIPTSNLSEDGSDPKAGDSYTVAVNAFTTYVKVSDIEKVEALSSVKGVYIANEYEKPEFKADMLTSTQMVNANIAWSEYNLRGEGTVIAVIDSGFDPSHKDFVLSDPTVPALTEAAVSALGLKGKYYTEKFPYAYNYYDLSHNIKDISTDGQHGQHVAGTVAANGTIKGVAPEAQLLGMKVFSDDFDYATTFSDIYLKAIEDSITLGADALNMSLGSPAGFYVEGSIEDVALKNALDNGIVSTISAGNEGTLMTDSMGWDSYLLIKYPYPSSKNPDIGLVGSPSLNEASLSVASVENLYSTVSQLNYTINGVTASAAMTVAAGSPEPTTLAGPQPIVRVGLGTAADFAAAGDVSGKVVVVMRGTNTFVDKLANAMNANASALIVYNHATGGEAMVNMAGGEGAKIPYVFIGNKAGVALDTAWKSAPDFVTVEFTDSMMLAPNPSGGLMSTFSSWGSTPDLRMKPEITAPGGMIYSLQNNDKYGTMSGTSMAAPHAAGGAAIVQQRLKTDPLFTSLSLTNAQRANLAKVLLMNTASILTDGDSYPYLVRQQGAGLMNVANALETSVYAVNKATGRAKVEFGDTTSKVLSTNLRLTNVSNVPVTYNVNTLMLTDYIVPATSKGHKVNLLSSDFVDHELTTPDVVTVPANGSVDLPVTMDFSAAELLNNQYVEGFIQLDTEDGSAVDLTVPFLGFYGDWDSLKVLDELRWNLLDTDIKNDPQFTLTTLAQTDEEGGLYFVDSTQPVWINPGNPDQRYGTGSIGLMASMLRNAEEINFRVLAEDGTVVREIGEHTNVRKIFKLSQNQPFTYFGNGVWDGTLNGEVAPDGSTYTYQVEVLRTKASTPQTLNFEIKVDSLAPVIESLDYDEETYDLTFKVSDEHSGLAYFEIENFVTGAYIGPNDNAALWAIDGQSEYTINIKDLLTGSSENYVALYVTDKANNYEGAGVILPPMNAVDAVPDAPVLNEVTTESLAVSGQATPYHNVKVTIATTVPLVLDTVANALGDFSVTLTTPLPEGTLVSATATNPVNTVLVSAVGSTVVVSLNNKVDVTLNLDGVQVNGETTLNLSNLVVQLTKGTEVFESTSKDVVPAVPAFHFTGLKSGDYKLKAFGLPSGVVVDTTKTSFKVTNSLSDDAVVLYLKTLAPVDEPEEGPYGQAQISIDAPGLLEAYKDGSILFEGKVFGRKDITSLVVGSTETGGTHELLLTPVEKESVVVGGVEVFYGTVYYFSENITLADGYYEYPFVVSNAEGEVATTNRRFWVDTTKPVLMAEVGSRDLASKTAVVNLTFQDNMSYLDVYRDDNFLVTLDWTDKGFNTRDVQGMMVDLVNLLPGVNTFTYRAYDIAGNETLVTIELERTDKSLLNSWISIVNAITPLTAELQAALDAAKLISANPLATQAEIDAAQAALQALLPENDKPVLLGVADMTVLKGSKVNLLAGVSALDGELDLTADITVTPDVIDTSVVGEVKVSYTVIDADGNVTSLGATINVVDSVEYEVVKNYLELLVEKALAIDTKGTTPESALALEEAIVAAQAVLANPDATQLEVNNAKSVLEAAMNGLVYPDVTALQAKLLEAQLTDTMGMLPSTVEALQLAMNEAKALLALDHYTQEVIDAALSKLVSALEGLAYPDRTALETKLAEAKLSSTAGMTEASVKALVDAIEAAETVLDKQYPTQEELDAALATLTSALAGLVKVDTTALKAKLAEAKATITVGMTEASVKALVDAIAAAEAVLAKENLTEAEIEAALALLTGALTGLTPVPIDPVKPPVGPSSLISGDVTVSGPVGAIPFGADLVVNKLDKTYAGYTGVAYEIYLTKDNVRIQPNNTVFVSIKLASGVTTASVFYDNNGKLEKVVSSVANGQVTFETDHFSTWLVGSQDVKPELPDTGSESTAIFMSIGLLTIAGGLYMITRKRREEQ